MNYFGITVLAFWSLLGCNAKDIDTSQTSLNTKSCFTDNTPMNAFELFPNQPTTQIHSDIAFDGQWIWIVFNLPNDDADFDVFLGAIDCNGNVVVEPKQILAIAGLNQTTPRIAISNDHILIAAQSDNGSSANNLSIHLHVQNRDGEQITEREWTPTIDDVEIGNRWLPSISGDEEGFWMTAAAANETHFQTALQRLNRNGENVGAPFWIGPDTYAVFPTIDGNETNFVAAWESGEESVQWITGSLDGMNEEYSEQANSSYPRVLWNDGSPNLFANRRTPLAVTMNDEQLSLMGNSHFPNAATGTSTTLIGYFKIQSGNANDVYISSLRDGAIDIQDSKLESTPPAAPYRPAVTNVGGDTYMLVWSGGEYPNFVLRGQFIDLTTTD